MNYQFMNGVDKISWLNELPDKNEDVCVEHFDNFFKMMFERQEIWYKRNVLKLPRPWTKDPFLRDYKFTNVYRELDRASQWMIENILLDHSLCVEDLLFRIFIFRFYNQPDTFDSGKFRVDLPHYDDFDCKKLHEQTAKRRKNVCNPWHTAYLMNLAFLKKPDNFVSEFGGIFKDFAYCEFAFQKVHDFIKPFANKLKNNSFQTPEDLCRELEKMPAVSTFQSHEFFLDLCYVSKYWKHPVIDWDENDYTNVGPGCSLGLRLVFPSLSAENQKEGICWLRDLAEEQFAKLGDFKYLEWSRKEQRYVLTGRFNLSLHQIEFSTCEFSKYWKMQIKVGKQRSKFELKSKPMESV